MTDAMLQKMLDNAVHFGHRTQNWNPKMKKYIYGSRRGIHIFDLEKTHKCLNNALEAVKRLISEGKTILFVGTKPQAFKIVTESAERSKMPYVSQKWIGGLLTNHSTVKKRIDYMKKLKSEDSQCGFEGYTKKEAVGFRKQIEKLESALGGLEDMNGLPDALFVIDVVRDDIAVKEAVKLGIPVIGIVDTNADPSQIDYVLPGNDDSIKSLQFFVDEITNAILEAKKTKNKV